MTILFVIAIDLLWIFQVVRHGPIPADLAVILGNLLAAVGLITLAHRGQSNYWIVFLYEFPWIGYYVGARLGWSKWRIRTHQPTVSTSACTATKGICVVVLVGTAYNFLAGGAAIFSSNVAAAKYDVTASGFNGFPSRLYLYGLPIALFCAVTTSPYAKDKWRKDRWICVMIAALLVSGLLSGNKGGVINALAVVVIAYLAVGNRPKISSRNVARALLVVVFLIVGVFAIASTYSVYQKKNQSLTSLLVDRVTIKAANPANLVLTKQLNTQEPNAIYNDWRYYSHKYFSLGSGYPNDFTRVVSATLFNQPVQTTHFLPPVTIGAPAQLSYGFSELASVVILFVMGLIPSLILSRYRRFPFGIVVGSIMSWAMLPIMVRGDIIYNILNIFLTSLILLIVGVVAASLLSTSKTSAPSAQTPIGS